MVTGRVGFRTMHFAQGRDYNFSMIQIIFLFVWTGFSHPESAVETDEGIYISDVGEFSMKDGVIWKVSGNSKVVVVRNLTDPKGLAVARGKIYVADIDRIWRIEKGGAVSLVVGPNSFPEAPRFLNGMAADATGYLYVSDTFGGWVYRLSTLGKVERLFKVDKPNGLAVASDGTVYTITFTNPGRIYAYKDGKAELVFSSEDIGGGDGLCLDEERGILYASGYNSGKIIRINLMTARSEVIAEGLTTPADINLSASGSKLLVPLLEAGEVVEINLGY